MTFNELNLIEPLLQALTTEGYTNPTPIQEQAIPIVLAKKDLLGVAQTGTGKTAAFALPIIQLLTTEHNHLNSKKNISCLILTPTRELAIQIADSFEAYGKHCKLKCAVIFGGVNQFSQVEKLKKGVDVLIATPGRLIDLGQQGFIQLNHLQIFVLDEADRMLDMGFIHDVKKIIAKLPTKRQTLFFSATMPMEIQELSKNILHNPEKVTITPVSSTAEKVAQIIYRVDTKEKKNLLNHLLQDENIKTALVFTRTKHGADKIVKELIKANISAAAIHGNKSQNNRQNALNNFKTGKIRILVATDIAARGIDIDKLAHVFNFDLPNIPETYVHRIGRTGRAGESGLAISFCDTEELDYLKDIQKLIGQKIPMAAEHPYLPSASSLANANSSQDSKKSNGKPQGSHQGQKNNFRRNNRFSRSR